MSFFSNDFEIEVKQEMLNNSNCYDAQDQKLWQ